MHRVFRMVELLPTRMVGHRLCSDQRSHSTDAGSVWSRAASGSHGRLSLALYNVSQQRLGSAGLLRNGLAAVFLIASAGGWTCYAAKIDQPSPKGAARINAQPMQMRSAPPRAIGLGKPREVPPTAEEMQAARGLEYLLVKNMVEQMRKTVPESEFMPKSHSERIFESMLDDEYVSRISESGQLGVAEQIVAQMRGRR